MAAAYGRRKERLGIALRCIAFACGGEGGARLAERLGMSVSGDLLLREIRRTSIPQIQVPRVLGVDDWAYRKGQLYGTVLIDLESGRPVEIRPDREPETLKTWLQDNPGVEIISRDRADYYIKGATEGAPNAIQVADRFHLVKNLREAMERLVGRHSQSVRSAFEQLRQDQPVPASVKQDTQMEADGLPPLEPTAADLKRQQLHDEVMSLRQQGVSMREISRRLGIHRQTVASFVQSNDCPRRAARCHSSNTNQCVDYVWRRWQEGCRSIRQLANEVQCT